MFDVRNELGEDVPGASITFQHQELFELTYRTTTAPDGTVTAYAYDPFNRRVSKTVRCALSSGPTPTS